MVFVTDDGREFAKKESAINWEKKLRGEPYKFIKKTRSDLGVKRNSYKSTLPNKYIQYLKRASAKKIAFDFTVDEFLHITSLNCSYCGSGGKMGIDRVDSSDGYTKENSVPCCAVCNMMKYTHSADDFLYHVKRVYEYNKARGTI